MIRTIPSGIGLSVLLGGGWRLVRRFDDAESATILVRGGAGAGKTLMALGVALEIAAARSGDVAVGCVEILPSEYLAQVRSARPDVSPERLMVVKGDEQLRVDGPGILYCGLLDELDPERPDVVAALERLLSAVERLGGKPAVLVLDSLIDGYGIGSSVPRRDADAVMKFAASRGLVLVLCEEAAASESAWVYAADTVLELGVESGPRGRWLEVRKHRFGPCATGRHELELGGEAGFQVYPSAAAWVSSSAQAAFPVLGHSRPTREPRTWQFRLPIQNEPSIAGRIVVVAGQRSGLVEELARNLSPSESFSNQVDLWFDMEPVGQGRGTEVRKELVRTCLPISGGPARALFRWLVDGDSLWRPEPGLGLIGPSHRIVIGDLGHVLSGSDGHRWVEAIRALGEVRLAWGADEPIVIYAGLGQDRDGARTLLGTLGDVLVEIGEPERFEREHLGAQFAISATVRGEATVRRYPQ